MRSRYWKAMAPKPLVLVVALFSAAFAADADEPIVATDVGQLKGLMLDINEGYMAEAFLGVPFAEPPIGNLRFEITKPVKPWQGVRDAQKAALACMQLEDMPEFITSEDCLYLNIARPTGTKPDAKLPVLFVIHGGAFELGYAYLNFVVRGNRVEQYLKDGIIVVAIQYRLGVYGFATTGTEILPGNLGYWDQYAALTFIYKHIAAFGGDPDRITVSGHSAGGASASMLAISPKTRDMVAGVIAMSGSPESAWATSEDPVRWTKKLIKVLGIRDDESARDRLKRASTDEISAALKKIGITEWGVNFGAFTPRQDGNFIPTDDFRQQNDDAPPKPMLTGITSEESLLWTLIGTENMSTGAIAIALERRANFGQRDFDELINKLVKEENYGEKTGEVRNKVRNFYMNGSIIGDNVFFLQKYTQIFSDLQFNFGVLYDGRIRSYRDWPVYLYLAPYVNKDCIPDHCPIRASYHGRDDYYLECDGKKNDDPDALIAEKFTIASMSAFIRTGNASTPGFHWKLSKAQHLAAIIDPKNIRMEVLTRYADATWFWQQLTYAYGYDMVRQFGKGGAMGFQPIISTVLGFALMKFLVL